MNIVDAYAAGLMDGEGSIMLSRAHAVGSAQGGAFRQPTCTLSSTSRELVEFMLQEYGGFICNQKKYKEHHKQAWIWRVSYTRANKLLRRILPFLKEKEKIRRAKMIVEEYPKLTKRNGQYTEQQRQLKLAFEKRFLRGNAKDVENAGDNMS